MRTDPVMRLDLGLRGNVEGLRGTGGDASFVGHLRVLANDGANADALAIAELLISACKRARAWVGLDLFLAARAVGDRTAQPWFHPLAWYKFGDSVPMIRCAIAAQSAQLVEIRRDAEGHFIVPTQRLVGLLLTAR